MNKAIPLSRNLISFGVPLIIISLMVLLARSSWFAANPESLSIGITFDLVITVPLLYFLLIRKTNIPKITTVPFVTGGLILSSYIIPQDHQFLLSQFKTWLVPIVEVGVLSLIVYKTSVIYKSYKSQKQESVDFFDTIRQATQSILPKKVDSIFAMEIATVYYAFVNWQKRELKPLEYSYHKENGTVAILSAIIGLVIVETAVFHLLIQQWSEIAAWVLSALSVYSGFQILGMVRSLSKRPIAIKADQLNLRFGIMSEANIKFDNIESVEISSRDIELGADTRKLSPLGDLDAHNLIIKLKEKGTLKGLYGFKKSFKTLALHVDDKQGFYSEVIKRIGQ